MPDARISELPAATAPSDADLAPLVQTTTGATLETRRATVAQLRNAVLADRGAHVRDYGAVGDGATDDAPAIQAAINDLKTKGGGTLQFGAKVYRIASAITLTNATIRLQGMGFTEGNGPGQGTWLKIDATGFTPFTIAGVGSRGAGVRDIAVMQTHGAALNSSWAPTAYDYVFRVQDCQGGVDFDNVFLCNVNRGIYANNSGRLDIRRLRGQVLTCGIEIDASLDVPRIHNVHFWPFWSVDSNVLGWQQANADAMIFRRCDGLFVDQAFALCYRSVFRFGASATTTGTTTRFYIGQAYADCAQYGVLVEADGVSGQLANFTHQGEIFGSGGQPLAGSNGIRINASNARLQIGNLRVDSVQDNALAVTGSGNRLDVFSLRCTKYNTRANGAAAIAIADSGSATPNEVYLGTPAQLESGNGGPLINAGTNGVLATGTPAGRAARPGLMVGTIDTGLFLPAPGTLAGTAGGSEVMRATGSGTITLGAAPGAHAFEVVTPNATTNHLVANGAATGSGVSLQAQGTDANIDIALTPKGGGLVRATPAANADASTAVATTGWVKAQGYVPSAAVPVQSVAGRTGAVTLTTDDVGFSASLGNGAAVLQAVGDGVTNAVTALEAALAAVSYDSAFVPAGTYVTTFAQAFQFPRRWTLASPGIAKIGSRTLPFGDIRADTTLYAGTGGTFTSINDALGYLHDRRIRPNATLTIQVADGAYTPLALLFSHPDGARARLLGNQSNPANCQLTFDATGNRSGIAALPGFSLGFIDGFAVVGSGARVSRTTWNANCYGAGVLANGGGNVTVGGNMTVRSFYYGYLADKGGAMRISPGAQSFNSGDVGFHSREGSYMLCDGCSASTGADIQSSGLVLGSGAAAELGSAMSCIDFTATDFQVGGVISSGNSSVWATGLWSTANTLYGAVVFSGTMMLGISPSGRVTKLNNNNGGLAVFNGGNVLMDHVAGSPCQINNNIFDGIIVDGARASAYGNYITQNGNGGFGIRAVNGGFARYPNGTIAGNAGATVTDSGRNSLALTS